MSDLMDLRFGGLSLVDRGIRTMVRAGIQRILVVVPAVAAPPSLSRITRKLNISLEVVPWGTAPEMHFPAGEDFLLLLGDYVHHHSSLSEAMADGLGTADFVALLSDSSQKSLPLLEAQVDGKAIRFREAAQDRDQLSSGAFLCAAALAPHELATAATDVWTFLSVRSAGGRAEARAGANHLWRRVVDRRTARDAKNMLFSQVTKKTSGFVSRHLNARFSIPTSKLLVETGISPHMVTVLFVLTTGLTSAYLFSMPDDYLYLAAAGILWQMAAVLDRCDGEIARVKLCESKFGAWFDTVTDNIAYLAMFAGLQVGMSRLHPGESLYTYVGVSALVALVFSLALLYRYAIKTGSGSLQHYQIGLKRHVPASDKGAVYVFVERHAYVVKRDFFAFAQFLLMILNQFELLYWLSMLIFHGMAFGILLSQSKMLAVYRAREAQPPSAAPLEAVSEAEDRR
ncbi:MAG TPA: CDP-alcohol phosphatidyltransferase family protein [Candidatus Latescibacteria bacterium]|nr:CDP-alcohol phosphatidyltransferase family protein [Candidatus Latescibacterota bacterium]